MRGLSLGWWFVLGLQLLSAARPFAAAARPTPTAANDVKDRIAAWFKEVAGLRTADGAAEPALYRYRGSNGRVVYTNIEQSVPAAQRTGALMDLTEVSLNSELGSDLDRQLAQQHRALQSSEVCTAARAAVEEPLWLRLWHEGGPLGVCAGALLLGALLTPWMFRRGWGAAWAKVLSTAISVLGFVGIAAFLLMQTHRSASNARASAQRCEPSTFANAPNLKERVQLVQALQREQQALEQIHAQSR